MRFKTANTMSQFSTKTLQSAPASSSKRTPRSKSKGWPTGSRLCLYANKKLGQIIKARNRTSLLMTPTTIIRMKIYWIGKRMCVRKLRRIRTSIFKLSMRSWAITNHQIRIQFSTTNARTATSCHNHFSNV